MFTDLIDIFTLLATLPNRGVVLIEAAFVIVTFLFALEFAAPLIVLVGFILKVSALIVLKASALPRVRLNAGRALPRPPGASGQNQIKESGGGTAISATSSVMPPADSKRLILATRRGRAPIAAEATPVWPCADEANRVLGESSDRRESHFAPHPIEALARAIGEARSWRDPDTPWSRMDRKTTRKLIANSTSPIVLVGRFAMCRKWSSYQPAFRFWPNPIFLARADRWAA
jgi:hypothetical protein